MFGNSLVYLKILFSKNVFMQLQGVKMYTQFKLLTVQITFIESMD